MTGYFCNNCGRPSHCSAPLYEDYRNWKMELMGQLKVCDMCSCPECTQKPDELELPHPGDIGC